MNGFALSNASGLQLDFYLRIFIVTFLTGVFGMTAVYGILALRRYHREYRQQQQHGGNMLLLEQQLYMQKLQAGNHQEFVALFVAYLEKFVTKKPSDSLKSLLSGAHFSSSEIKHIIEVYYGNNELDSDLREKMIKELRIKS
jgi:hypothetical protein